MLRTHGDDESPTKTMVLVVTELSHNNDGVTDGLCDQTNAKV